MSTIEELRQRVESAERRFGLIDEQQRRYSERLIGLMDALEAAQEERQGEAAAHGARIAELERENGELRGMLHALLLGVEAGSRDLLAETLRDLDARLSGMVRPAAATRGAADALDDTAAEIPSAEIAVADALDDEIALEETPRIDHPVEETPSDALPADESPAVEDAVDAAEQAVAALLSGSGEAEPGWDNIAGADNPGDEATVDEMVDGEGLDAGGTDLDHGASPVAEMIGRLADGTRDFAEPAPEPPLGATAPQGGAAPENSAEPAFRSA